MKVPILIFSSVLVKICQIPHVIFQTTSQFFFKFCMTAKCHEILLLCNFLGQMSYTLHERNLSKWKFLRLECLDQNSPNSCHFWNNKLVFIQILHHSSVSWDLTPLYFFNWNFIYFQQKEPIKVQIWWNQKYEIWHFDGLLLSK